jgi:hypothetical protein
MLRVPTTKEPEMNTRKPMVSTVNANTARREVAVVVEHADWQSFSRAVLPRARKEFRSWIYANVMFGDLCEVAANLGGGALRTDPNRCVSVVYFTY